MAVLTYSCSAQGNQSIAGTRFVVQDFQCHNGEDKVLIDSNLAVLLQAIENHFNSRITITSAYRPAGYNASIGGASNSYHTKGQAADISLSGVSLYNIARYADYKLGQKGGVGCYPNSGFVHVDTRGFAAYWEDTGWQSSPYKGDSSDPPLNLNIENTSGTAASPPATGTIQGVQYGQSAEQVFNSSGYSKYASLFERWGKEYNIDPNLLAALGMQESGLTDISSGPAWGVMQIENTLLDANEGWPNGWLSFGAYGRKYGSAWTSDDRLDGAKNIEYAAYVLNQGFAHYGGDILKTVQQYNYSHYTVDALVATYGDNWFTSGRASKKGYGDGQYVEHVFRYWRPNSLDGRYNNSGSNTVVNGSTSLPITTSVIKSVVGGAGAVRTNPMQDKNTLGGGVELYIVNHDNTVFYPVCSGETALTYERKDVPTKLEFTVVKTPELDFKEGAQVVFKKNGISMFYGYVFEKSRNKGSTIKVVAYDQLRYFKNKDCYVYENLNLAELLKMIANDYNLTCGNLPDTGYKIPLRVEDNVTIFDILQNAVDETLLNTGELYVIYDDFGELKVRNIKDWITDFVVDKETACDIDYKTSINDTSNRIKLYYDNGNTGEREIYINNNEEKINEWGVLQHCEKIEDGEDGVKKAEILSQLHCKKTRTLNIQNVFGNPHIRAGCMVCVILDLGDVMQQNFMLCETVKHKISNGKHVMDLSLKGGVFQD